MSYRELSSPRLLFQVQRGGGWRRGGGSRMAGRRFSSQQRLDWWLPCLFDLFCFVRWSICGCWPFHQHPITGLMFHSEKYETLRMMRLLHTQRFKQFKDPRKRLLNNLDIIHRFDLIILIGIRAGDSSDLYLTANWCYWSKQSSGKL